MGTLLAPGEYAAAYMDLVHAAQQRDTAAGRSTADRLTRELGPQSIQVAAERERMLACVTWRDRPETCAERLLTLNADAAAVTTRRGMDRGVRPAG